MTIFNFFILMLSAKMTQLILDSTARCASAQTLLLCLAQEELIIQLFC